MLAVVGGPWFCAYKRRIENQRQREKYVATTQPQCNLSVARAIASNASVSAQEEVTGITKETSKKVDERSQD